MQYCYCSFGELKGALGSTMCSVADLDPQSAAENAVSVIGHGYDLCKDIRFSSCKSESLIEIDLKQMRDVVFPGGVVVSGVPFSPVAFFNSLIYIESHKTGILRFIEKYGTHVVVAVKMGKDVVHMKQLRSSDLQHTKVKSKDSSCEYGIVYRPSFEPFGGSKRLFHAASRPVVKSLTKNDDIGSISIRRGGIDTGQSMLLNSIPGNELVSQAMNLYLRYKPPIEELQQFLEYQLPRQWAPVYSDPPLRFGGGNRRNMSPSLNFSLIGPKVYVNTTNVIN
ncbi:hypothetical protein K1719_045737 [Acacia pycnantha]|nr:hypothetical protein K1719_045737 [Acacia pycnantha]